MKNCFTNRARGRVYSSLDADNFVTIKESLQILDALKDYPEGFIFHHFSGTWGDGSSGRVSMTMPLYQRVGYDPRMLPRQFDEIDMILSSMIAAPRVPLLRYDTGANHAVSSGRVQATLCEGNLLNPIVIWPRASPTSIA